MILDRRTLLAGFAAGVLVPREARAATVTDATGRPIIIPDKVERIFAAGPPAAILLYTLAPELLLGWTKSHLSRGSAHFWDRVPVTNLRWGASLAAAT